jgi:hypothetical protein
VPQRRVAPSGDFWTYGVAALGLILRSSNMPAFFDLWPGLLQLLWEKKRKTYVKILVVVDHNQRMILECTNMHSHATFVAICNRKKTFKFCFCFVHEITYLQLYIDTMKPNINF